MNDPFVIPLKAGEKRPLETDWQLNTARMSEAAKRWPGIDRWGMPCGPINGLWCLDVDVKTGGPATLADLESRHGSLPRTLEVRTQSGGRHLYFRWDPERPVGCWVGRLPGVDTRGPGGQAVIPPTPGYTLVHDVEPADAPEWLYVALRADAPVPGADEAHGDRPPGLPADLPGALRYVRSFPPAGEGERGAGVWRLAVHLVRGYGLDPDAAAQLIEEHWNPRNTPPWGEDETHAIDRACRRAETQAKVPWGFLFYHGRLNDVLLQSIRRYGPKGQEGSGIPYRVWPDGSMRRLDLKEGLAQAVRNVIRETGGTDPTTEQLWRYVSWWKVNANIVGLFPTPVVVNDAPGPSLCRLAVTPGETPAWDEFLTRLDSPDVFLGWVWMLTLPTATRQVLWLQGDGSDGKTEAAAAIAAVLGESATTVDDGFMDTASRWVGSQVYGKRFLLVDDTKMRQVLRRGIVHRITGRSPMKCEFKGVDGFDFRPNVAVLCTSNFAPLIGRGRADRTRLLPVMVTGNGQTADKAWSKRLQDEFPALLAKAEMAYERLAVKLGEAQLRVDVEAAPRAAKRLRVAAEVDEETYLAVLEAAGLVLDPEGKISGREFFDRIPFKLNSNEYHDFRQWLEEKGIARSTDHAADVRYWNGVRAAK